MRLAEAVATLERVTVPDHWWVIDVPPLGGVIVRAVHRVNDARDAGWALLAAGRPQVEIATEHEFGTTEFALMGAEDLIAWCFVAVKGLAEHEVEEWFRVDGALYQDPHPRPSALAGYAAWLVERRAS